MGLLRQETSPIEMERAEGIEPSCEAWKASVLPLNYARVLEWNSASRLFSPIQTDRLEALSHYDAPNLSG